MEKKNLYEQQIEKLKAAMQEGSREAYDYLMTDPPDDDVRTRLVLAKNTAERAPDVLVAARCAGRFAVFDLYLADDDGLKDESAAEAGEVT